MKRLAVVLFAMLTSPGFAQQSEALELLKSKDWDGALVRITTEKARLAPEIVKCLADEDNKVKARAAIALRTIDSADQAARSGADEGLGSNRPAAVAALAKSAKLTEPAVRKESVWALAYLLRNRDYGHHGEPWSNPKEVQPIVDLGRIVTQPLSQLLAYEDPNDGVLYGVKIAAVRVLAALKDPSAIDALIALVKSSQHFLQSEAMYALTKFDDPRIVGVLIDSIDDKIASYGDTPGVWALRKMKQRAVPELLWAVAHHPKAAVRSGAASVFEYTPDPRAVPVLQAATEDPDEFVRTSAAAILAFNPHRSNTAVLLPLLSDSSKYVRSAAIETLAAIGDKSTFDAVVALLSDQENSVRSDVAAALPHLDPSRAIPVLIPLLKDVELQRTVISALSPFRPKEAESSLIELLKGGDEYVRADAATLLGEMKSVAAIPALLATLQVVDWYQQGRAARALSAIGKPAVESLLELLPKSSNEVLPYVLEALGPIGDPRAFEPICSFLSDPEIRVQAVEALGKMGDKRAIPLILPYLTSPNSYLLRTAVEAAGDLKATEAVPLLIKALSYDGDYVASTAVEALGKIGDKRAFDPLFKIAQDPAFEGRWMAIEGLGSFADSRAVPVLIKLLEEDWPNDAAAARALGRLGDRSALPALKKSGGVRRGSTSQ